MDVDLDLWCVDLVDVVTVAAAPAVPMPADIPVRSFRPGQLVDQAGTSFFQAFFKFQQRHTDPPNA